MRQVASALAGVAMLIFPSVTRAQTAAPAGQATAAPKAPATGKSRAATTATKKPPSASLLATQKAADKARQENRLDDAVAEYFKAVQLQPDWTEGWWYLGLISYEQDRSLPARDAFRRVVTLDPGNARAWGLMGLSEFQLKDYDPALDHLQHARQLRLVASSDLASPVRYHVAVLLTRLGLADQAQQVLNEFAVEGNDSPKVIEAFGIAALRLPVLPAELPGEKRDAVMMAGRAQYFSAARLLPAAKQAFEQLVTRYPDLPNAHYASGVFLLGEEPDLGVAELQKELKVTPGHSLAMLSLAFEYLRRGELDVAKDWAQKAVTVDPSNFVAHKAMGQVLLESGDTEGAIRELEIGVRMASDSPALRFQLAKAYQKAGRTADAERERAEFTRLDRALRALRAGSQSVGGTEAKPVASTPPPPTEPQ